MQVILLKDVSGVGQKGSVKTVSDGYALNHLIPNKMAQMATKEALATLEKKNQADKELDARRQKEWAEISGKMKQFKLMLRANASEQGHLFKKISSEEIAKALLENGIDVPADAIHPKMPIKQTGVWPVEIKLGIHESTINVEVVAS